MDVPWPRKWLLVKLFQIVSPSAHDKSHPVGSLLGWGQFPNISVLHISHSFSKYQISSIELSYLNISVIMSSEFLPILG